jgi:hypothetical protein
MPLRTRRHIELMHSERHDRRDHYADMDGVARFRRQDMEGRIVDVLQSDRAKLSGWGEGRWEEMAYQCPNGQRYRASRRMSSEGAGRRTEGCADQQESKTESAKTLLGMHRGKAGVPSQERLDALA